MNKTTNKAREGERQTAVVYLRVSSIGQVNTDRDGEGFSIAAQRDACLRKAENLNADVLEVYIDAGESAKKKPTDPNSSPCSSG